MFSEFVFGKMVTPITYFYVMYSASCLRHNRGHILAQRVLTNQRNFIRYQYITIQKGQHFYLIKNVSFIDKNLHQTKPLLK